jgi:hypothetical protein
MRIQFFPLVERDLPDFIIYYLEYQKLCKWRSGVFYPAYCCATSRQASASSHICIGSGRNFLDGGCWLADQTAEPAMRYAELGPVYRYSPTDLVHTL